jgi:serine/threonine-protein kinase
MASDRHLLFGLLALQTGLIQQMQLVAAFHAWTGDKSRTLADHLVALGYLNAAQRAAVESLVDVHVEAHDGDVGRSLAAVPAGPSTRRGLGSIDDPDLVASLTALPSPGWDDWTHDRPAEATEAHARVTLAETDADDGPLLTPAGADPPLDWAAGRYEFLGEIARGGMGAVLKARDSGLGRDLALKILLDRHRERPDLVDRFIEEAQICGQLQHPGIVPVYELGTLGDRRPFFTMKLVKGRTLAALLAERTEPDLPRFLSIFEAVCQRLAYAHARGVIHRDLKPSNVMVGSFGEVQVMDWGLAKILPRDGQPARVEREPPTETVVATLRCMSDSELSQAGSVLGTPAYMAPEQARGETDRIDRRADVFALGSILCEILTGQAAFHGRSVGEIHRKAALGDLADAAARLDSSGADGELIALAKDALAPERDDRPRDAGAVARRITGYLAGVQEKLRAAELARAAEQARAEEAEARAKAERQARRLTAALAASALGFIILGGGGWVYLQQLRAGRRLATERVVNQALDEATLLWGQARSAAVGDLSPWSAALNAARRAEGLLATGEVGVPVHDRSRAVIAALEQGQAEAQSRAHEARRDRELLDRLETILGERSQHDNAERTDADYAKAFRDFGLDFARLEPKEAGRRLAARSAPVEMASFLDDWGYVRAYFPPDKERGLWRRLNEAARAADPDPWRDSLRAQIKSTDKSVLLRLADDEKALEGQPATSLLLLAHSLQLQNDRSRAERVLLCAWRLHPDDYWVNDRLGWLYLWGTGLWSPETKPAEAARYYSAAVAIRPRSAAAHVNLGVALGPIRLERAVAELREAIRLDAGSAAAHINLAITLNQQGQVAEMMAEFREAIRVEPTSATAHEGLGAGLYRQGKQEEAIVELRESLRLRPDNEKVHNNLAWVFLMTPGRPRPDLEEALVHARRAVELKTDQGTCLGTLALAEYRAGHWTESIRAGERAAALTKGGSAEAGFILAMSCWQKGARDEARKWFDKAVAWAGQEAPRDPDLRLLWLESAKLLGRPGPGAADPVRPTDLPTDVFAP